MSTADAGPVQEWTVTLDQFEQRLADQWSAFETGAPDAIEPFQPPALASSLPEDLRDRAVDLVRRCRALEDALAATLERVAGQLADVAETKAAPVRTGGAEPAYFDSRV